MRSSTHTPSSPYYFPAHTDKTSIHRPPLPLTLRQCEKTGRKLFIWLSLHLYHAPLPHACPASPPSGSADSAIQGDDFLLCCRYFGVRDRSVMACRCGLFANCRCWFGWAFRSGKFALPYAGSREALLAVDGFDGALEAVVSWGKRRKHVDGIGKFVDWCC